ncbi:MAG TPA: cytochrome b N-terminal domain-containing protein [Polyangia bacterium]|jgi:ubiquinol-cytochrome c reductase cytochrome b subunit|nr:cytochrome b N-terminal domain-containing protein [Polyangia bacterium]
MNTGPVPVLQPPRPPTGERATLPIGRRSWLEERLGLGGLQNAILGGEMPGGASLWHALGSVAAGLFVVEAVTGIFLALFYAPSVQTAWASVAYIQDQLPLGWFVRGLHSFGSSALIVVAGLHLLQVLVLGAYRRPREANWILGLALFGLTVLFALSGYLLPWDQKGYWAKLVEATITGSAPVVGGAVQQLVQGGTAFGNLTVTHAFAAHALLLPAAFIAFLVLHVYLYRKHGPTPRWSLSAAEIAARTESAWPYQAVRNAALGLAVLAVVIVEVAARHGAALESPADPTSSYLARPEWYALPLFQLRMYFEGPLEIVATMVIPGLVTALLLALPFLDRARSNRPSDRKPVMAAMGLALLAVGALSTIALVKDAHDPAYAKARAEEETRTREARRLAEKGMPAEGGLAVFQNDPLNHARAIWEERCSGCHGLVGAGGDKGPDFKDYDSRAWIRGFLENPEGPLYMGTAKIDRGMKPVQGTPEELDALVEMVYAQTGAADADAAKAARGHGLVAQKDCDTCHELDGEGENAGPNLKGRGTLAWVEAMIADAGQGRLFGEKNKMPKFAGKLTPAEIEDLARFVVAQKGTQPPR